ncbi:MAG: PAS domain-containing protein [Rhodospirillaceae bacterium]|nr:PAS domain-containing protein [Rhodospirillaceae bacterium]
MPLPSALDHIRDSRLRRFTEYWLGRRRGRLVPCRADIDVTDVPWILPWIWLMQYFPDSDRFLCRVAGDNVNAFLCCNIGGHYIGGHFMDEYLPSQALAELSDRYRAVLRDRVIMHASGLFTTQSYHADGERVAFPLSEDGTTVDLVIGASLYGSRPPDGESLVDDSTVPRYTPLADLPGS